MEIIKNKKVVATLLLGTLLLLNRPSVAMEGCPAPPSCAPCGEFVTNMPLPTFDTCGVQPFQNYLATSESCLRSITNGFYLGTGFGYGEVDYKFNVPGIVFPTTTTNRNKNSYIIEYISIGFAHSTNRFFIAGELAYYYNSIRAPFFYEDPSFITVVVPPVPPEPGVVVTDIPCSVRVDINGQNHVALDFLPGFVLTPCLNIFARLGLEYTSYSWVRRVCIPTGAIDILGGAILVGLINDPILGPLPDVTDKENDNIIDFRLGAGVSFAVAPHVSLTLNYVHVFGSRASFTPDVDTIPPLGGLVFTAPATFTINTATLLAQNHIDPERNEVLFGVMFYF